MAVEQADAPIKTSDAEWETAVNKLLRQSPAAYTAEEMQAAQKMRESFPDKDEVSDKGIITCVQFRIQRSHSFAKLFIYCNFLWAELLMFLRARDFQAAEESEAVEKSN